MTDVLISGSTGSLGKIIAHSLSPKTCNIIPVNLRNLSCFKNKVTNNADSVFLHMASLNSTMRDKDINYEVSLTKSAIEIAKANSVNRFIFFSTSKLYSQTEDLTKVNEKSVIIANTPYTKAKKQCEEVLNNNRDNFNSIIILRLAPVITQSPSSNMNLLFKLCKTLPIVPLFPAGFRNHRSFLSHINLANFLNILILGPEKMGINIINVSDKKAISTNDLINTFLTKYRPNALKVLLPSFVEYIAFFIPFFGKQLRSMYSSNLLSNSKIQDAFPEFKLLDTQEIMEKYGLFDNECQ